MTLGRVDYANGKIYDGRHEHSQASVVIEFFAPFSAFPLGYDFAMLELRPWPCPRPCLLLSFYVWLVWLPLVCMVVLDRKISSLFPNSSFYY